MKGQSIVAQLIAAQQALREHRFQALQDQITTSFQARVDNAQSSTSGLRVESELKKSGLLLRVTAAGGVYAGLKATFKSEETEVSIRSAASNYTIRAIFIEPADAVLQYRQRSGSWNVLEDAAAVERLLDHAFQATFGA